MIEVLIGDDKAYFEKKYIILDPSALESAIDIKKINEEGFREEDAKLDNFSFHHEDDDIEEVETDIVDDLDDIEIIDDIQSKGSDLEMLQIKLQKSLQELEDIRSDMNKTFTSTDTIQSTIVSIRGMLDALRKDQFSN